MRALSMLMEEAQRIASGAQTVLAKCWATEHRGPLLLVGTERGRMTHPHRGKAVCMVNVQGCREMLPEDAAGACCEFSLHFVVWFLANRVPVEPVDITGEACIYDVPPETAAAIEAGIKSQSYAPSRPANASKAGKAPATPSRANPVGMADVAAQPKKPSKPPEPGGLFG